MKTELIVGVKIEREKFVNETFVGTDDIFALVEQGSFVCSHEGKTETARALDGFCFRAGVLYKRKVLEPVTLFMFRYRSDELGFPGGRIVFSDRAHVTSTVSILNAVYAHPEFDEYGSKQALFYSLFLQYRSEHLERYANIGRDSKVQYAKQYLLENLRTKVDLRKLAEDCQLSYIQFFRRFKADTAMSPEEYLMSLRMKRAAEILASTSLTIRMIAVECGFYDEYYFSNYFKKYYRISPSEYRKSTR